MIGPLNQFDWSIVVRTWLAGFARIISAYGADSKHYSKSVNG